jgi:ribosomal protein L40E
VSQEARCPSCGALVSAEAEWCGQCYARLPRAVEAEGRRPTIVETPGGGRLDVSGDRPAWDCPVCGERNPIEATTCSTCGTPFTRLFEQPVERPEIEPQTAAVWSLVWPGLGHWKAGYRGEAIARIVLFAWTFGTLVALVVSRFGKGGLGATLPLFALFLASAAAVYVLSALDAYRLAGGGPPLVSSRVLLWASAAVVLVSVILATLVTLPAARR